MYKAREAFVE